MFDVQNVAVSAGQPNPQSNTKDWKSKRPEKEIKFCPFVARGNVCPYQEYVDYGSIVYHVQLLGIII